MRWGDDMQQRGAKTNPLHMGCALFHLSYWGA